MSHAELQNVEVQKSSENCPRENYPETQLNMKILKQPGKNVVMTKLDYLTFF